MVVRPASIDWEGGKISAVSLCLFGTFFYKSYVKLRGYNPEVIGNLAEALGSMFASTAKS